MRIATEIHGSPVALEALAGIASLQMKRGDLEQALELLLIVLNHPASIQETKDRAAHLHAELESQLTPSQIESLKAHAAEKSVEAVVADLLN